MLILLIIAIGTNFYKGPTGTRVGTNFYKGPTGTRVPGTRVQGLGEIVNRSGTRVAIKIQVRSYA
jgi:hypothetical protein